MNIKDTAKTAKVSKEGHNPTPVDERTRLRAGHTLWATPLLFVATTPLLVVEPLTLTAVGVCMLTGMLVMAVWVTWLDTLHFTMATPGEMHFIGFLALGVVVAEFVIKATVRIAGVVGIAMVVVAFGAFMAALAGAGSSSRR